MYVLGYDVGSSSVKAALVKANTGEPVHIVQYPDSEMHMIAHQAGWAEQEPEWWWQSLCQATKQLLKETKIDPKKIQSIGIAYQMHGLVLVDKDLQVLRPAIIWCDSRAVEIGRQAFKEIGKEKCLTHFLNSPGNFTASKLKWVKDNEPELYHKIYKVLLPGDYIAMKLTGALNTTISGLSEGIFWDFVNHDVADELLDYYELSRSHIPNITDTFGIQGKTHKAAAEATGLATGIPVAYRAGDQPNNALSLGVTQAGEVAATGGTSGVVYGIADRLTYDPKSRINGFAHVNHSPENPRLGLLLCINGAGIQYAWMKSQMAQSSTTYADMEQMAQRIAVGADGLRILPFGNGAERMLSNKNTGAQINKLQFNRHSQAHMYRAALEGIAFSFVYGFQIMKDLGLTPKTIKVGNDNLFRSSVLSMTIANLLECSIEVINTTGAVGAAQASGIGLGLFQNMEEALSHNTAEQVYYPDTTVEAYEAAYQSWYEDLKQLMK